MEARNGDPDRSPHFRGGGRFQRDCLWALPPASRGLEGADDQDIAHLAHLPPGLLRGFPHPFSEESCSLTRHMQWTRRLRACFRLAASGGAPLMCIVRRHSVRFCHSSCRIAMSRHCKSRSGLHFWKCSPRLPSLVFWRAFCLAQFIRLTREPKTEY